MLTADEQQYSLQKAPQDGSTGGLPYKSVKHVSRNLQPHMNTTNDIEPEETKSRREDNQSSQLVCRICLSEEEQGNPMLCPCNCAGSMGAIHMLCLREWLANKRQVFEGARVTSFFWKLLECELCKEPFERKMRSTLFNILEFDLPDGQGVYKFGRGDNYMILESINSMPAKVVHVFNLRYDNFRAGRSVEADMKIADISVSRFHSYFRVRD